MLYFFNLHAWKKESKKFQDIDKLKDLFAIAQ